MSKLKNLNASTVLRSLTHLKPKTRNATRWNSVFTMVQRYYALKPIFVELLEDLPEMADYMLSVRENQQLDNLRPTLLNLHAVTLKLQDSNITFAEVRAIFDHVIKTYPGMISPSYVLEFCLIS
jgi:hypothetical protein